MATQENLITLVQAAQQVDRSLRTMSEWIWQGRLQATAVDHGSGHAWLVTADDVHIALMNDWTDEQKQANIVTNQLIRGLSLERV